MVAFAAQPAEKGPFQQSGVRQRRRSGRWWPSSKGWRRQPVLMLFEDAQWSDPTSLELYDLIIDRVPAVRVLLIMTYRPGFSAPWTGRRHVTALVLNRLAPRQQEEMIAG
jgi:hypothetical protein